MDQLERIHDSGIKFVRKDLYWSSVEAVIGEYNFQEYDAFLKGLEQQNIRALFILCYGNTLYPGPEDSEEGRQAYAKFAAAAVEYFISRNVLWEI